LSEERVEAHADAGSERDGLTARIHAIEEAYEFMLGYAAQGLPGDAGTQSGGQLRMYLARAVEALTAIGDALAAASPTGDAFTEFRGIVEQDARRALAAVRLVAVQPSISSQVVDSLNASIHLRTLLTDLFLLDELLKPGPAA
jgi:hypothetical protein